MGVDQPAAGVLVFTHKSGNWGRAIGVRSERKAQRRKKEKKRKKEGKKKGNQGANNLMKNW
jgi:hypothetical protein